MMLPQHGPVSSHKSAAYQGLIIWLDSMNSLESCIFLGSLEAGPPSAALSPGSRLSKLFRQDAPPNRNRLRPAAYLLRILALHTMAAAYGTSAQSLPLHKLGYPWSKHSESLGTVNISSTIKTYRHFLTIWISITCEVLHSVRY